MEITTVTIFWLDAAQDSAEEHHCPEDIFYPLAAISSGLLIEETDEYIAIARDYFPTDGVRETGIRQRLSIPKGMIQRLIKFKIT